MSFLRTQESRPPLPRRERVASRPGWPGEGGDVSFLRPCVIPAQAGTQAPYVPPHVSFLRKQEPRKKYNWIPTFVGMTQKAPLPMSGSGRLQAKAQPGEGQP